MRGSGRPVVAVLGLVGCLFAGSSVAEAATPGGSARRTTPSVKLQSFE